MNIKSMLLRLQSALGQDNLSDQMLLYSGAVTTRRDSGNFVIGYNGSPNSQTALDFVLWMAHQTRLATQKAVTVHVVYVIDCYDSLNPSLVTPVTPISTEHQCQLLSADAFGFQCGTVMALPSGTSGGSTQTAERASASTATLTHLLERVDRVLWQARCLSDEWRGSLEAHLRFGAVATELRQVVEEQSADLLVVGCSSVEHPLVQQLIPCVTCPILGIPTELEAGLEGN